MNSSNKKTRRHPEWIRASLTRTARGGGVRSTLAKNGINTVCEEARCPNRGECWDSGTATFLIMGDTCTRNCGYCSVVQGVPDALYQDEPRRVASAAKELGCRYIVITSVTRDDLQDGGASVFADTVRKIKDTIEGARVELLVPDFRGDSESIMKVADAEPDVFGHNIETVRSLFTVVRPQGDYERSLSLLQFLKKERQDMVLKSGLMVGLGETRAEITIALNDLKSVGVDIVTVGQYLQPSKDCVPVVSYVHPDEFDEIQNEAMEVGFDSAVCGPLVRSSYHAEEVFSGRCNNES